MISPLPGIGRGDIRSGARSLWRYAASFPIPVADPVSMGEGCTPLVERRWGGARALFKLEWFAPTGSFKDRGASVMISIFSQQGVTELIEDSSGNGGAAIAAYAAAAGIKAKILVPATTQPGKTVQMRAYGAEVQLIPGSRQDTADEAARQAGRIFYASHNWQAFFLQGTKTLAYELWEDLGFRAPDNVLIPTGAGSNVLGCDIGFSELLRRGRSSGFPGSSPSSPQIARRSARASPRALKTPAREDPSDDRRRNRHRGSVRTREVLAAIRRSGGAAVPVTEEEIVEAMVALARSGLYVEPTSASAAAALSGLIRRGVIGPEETTVVVLTGSGLKAAQRIGELMGVLPIKV